MFISDVAIRRPVITVVTMLALVGFGAYALLNLETDEFPEIQAPIVAVSVPYPGAAPETVARELLEPIEEALQSLSGVDEIQSTAMDGFAQIITTFDFSTPVEQASQDVRDAISGIRGDLPTQMEEPIIRRFDPADLPIVSLVLTSPKLSAAELTRIADPRITRALRSINGVAQVNLVGGVERELTVQLDPDALRAANVSVSQVVEALQTQNLAAPVGSLVGATEERSIRLQGRLQTPAEFRQIVVAQRGGQLVRLEQVASVVDASEEPRSVALFDGGRAIGLDVLKSRGTSTTRVAEDVVNAAQLLTPSLPGGVSLRVVRNAGERVAESVTNVQHALVEGAALTVLVVFLFLNSWRSTVITGLALPVSVVASFIAVLAFGFTLNTMSLLGLSLAIGILIDDAIVVRENIVRHVQMGKDHLRASFEATDEIGMAVAATTFSIVAVFVPIAFMEGIAGQWFKPFALTIACSVLVSLFVSFSLDPMLSAYWPDPHRDEAERGRITRLLDRFNAWFDRQADRYRTVIGWALDHRWTMVGLALASLVGAVALQVMFGGFGFAPDSDRSELTLQLEAPPGASIDYTRLKANEIGEIIRRHDAVAYTYTTVGGGGGDFGSTGSVDTASIYVRMKPRSERSVSQQDFGRELREELQSVNNATVALFTSGFGGAQRQMQMRVLGPDPDQLTRVATQVADQIRQVPNTVDVELSTRGEKPELEVEVDRALASTLGVSVADVGQALRIAFAGVDAGDWVDPSGETRDVMVRLAPEARTRAADLEQLPLVVSNTPVGTSGDGGSGQRTAGPDVLPLRQVASITSGLGPAQIQHLDGDSVITVGANIEGRSLGEVTSDVQQRLAALALPAGYRIEPGGESQDQQEVFIDVFGALGLAIMLMYLILVAQFGSFVDPLAILISLPLSLIGVVLALLVTRDTLNIMSLIGVILLMGVVAKNAILLIDFAKWTRETGVDRRTAIIEAGRIRLRPIIMTTFALIAGMTPVALGIGEGADFRAPLGRAVIGGVVTSTLLTLLVIPTIYEILDDVRAWVVGRTSGFLHHEPASDRV